MRSRRGSLLILAAAGLFGTTGTAQALGAPDGSPLAVGLARLVIGGAGLVAAAWVTGERSLRGIPTGPALVGAASVVAYQLSFFAGVRSSGVALGTVITIGSAPVFAGLLARAALGERLERRWVIATAVAVAGVALIGRPGGDAPTVGIALNLLAGLSYAVFATASKRLVTRRGAAAAMAVVFGAGALVSVPLLAATDLSFLTDLSGWAAVLWLGLAATTLAYLLYGAGIRETPVSTAATLTLFEPVVATTLGVVMLGEQTDPITWVGVALIGASLAALTARRP